MFLKSYRATYKNQPRDLIAAHEMGHSIIALENKLRLQYTSIIITKNCKLPSARALIGHGGRQCIGNFQAGGVAGVIFYKIAQNRTPLINMEKDFYKDSIWGSIEDIKKFQAEREIKNPFKLKKEFYKAVLECLPIIEKNRIAFFSGITALKKHRIVFGSEMKSIYSNGFFERKKDFDCLRTLAETGKVPHQFSSIDRSWM